MHGCRVPQRGVQHAVRPLDVQHIFRRVDRQRRGRVRRRLSSATSIASVGSVASVGSLLSAASHGSVFSVGSHGCVGGLFEDCTKEATHPIETWVEVHLEEDVYDLMASCTKEEYRQKPRPDRCNYQDATCVFVNMTSGSNETRDCQARRKGNTSWRKMKDKPSFKLKKIRTRSERDDVHFGTFACGGEGGELCPPGVMSNVWRTNKVTLNNQVQGDGEIDAYAAFRRIAPGALAVQTHVNVFRGGTLQTADTYVLLETIDDSRFTRKWFGLNTALYETTSSTSTQSSSMRCLPSSTTTYADRSSRPSDRAHPSNPSRTVSRAKTVGTLHGSDA